jgi:hypothetical protein
VVGTVATNSGTLATTLTAADSKLASINSNVNKLDGKVNTANTSLTNLSNTITTVGTEKYIKTSVNQTVPPSSLYVQNVVITGSGRPLKDVTLQNGVTVKASTSNVGTIYVGGPSIQNNISNGYPLEAGQELFISISNASLVYVRTSSGRSASLHVIGS